MQVLAPAKINLSLKVLGKRKDGFHEIETLIAPVSLYDKIEIEKQSRWIDFSCDDPTLSTGDDNLVVRAAKLFFERTKIKERRCRSNWRRRFHTAQGWAAGAAMQRRHCVP